MKDLGRWGVVLLGLAILVSDVIQDYAFLQLENSGGAALVGAMVVRNLLMVVALGLFVVDSRWSAPALAVVAVLGLVRRAQWLIPVSHVVQWEGWSGPTGAALHSGADLAFRIVIIFLALELFRRSPDE